MMKVTLLSILEKSPVQKLKEEIGGWGLRAIWVENNSYFSPSPVLHNYALFTCGQVMSHKLVLLMLLGGFLESFKAKT